MWRGARRSARRDDAHAQFAQAIDTGHQLVTHLGCAHPRRGAGENDVTDLERVILGQKCDLLRHTPDHLVDIGLLAELAVHLEPELALGRMPYLACRRDRPARRGLVEILAEAPWTALVLSLLLQVAAGHVETDRITPDMVIGALGGDLVATLADEHTSE